MHAKKCSQIHKKAGCATYLPSCKFLPANKSAGNSSNKPELATQSVCCEVTPPFGCYINNGAIPGQRAQEIGRQEQKISRFSPWNVIVKTAYQSTENKN